MSRFSCERLGPNRSGGPEYGLGGLEENERRVSWKREELQGNKGKSIHQQSCARVNTSTCYFLLGTSRSGCVCRAVQANERNHFAKVMFP